MNFAKITMLSLFAIVFFTHGFSQKKPLLHSITSDTLKGKFQQLTFEYDQWNRVVRLAQLDADAKKRTLRAEQLFVYDDSNALPSGRTYRLFERNDSSGKDICILQQVQYFLYEDGKRVTDLLFYTRLEAYSHELGRWAVLDGGEVSAEPQNSHTSTLTWSGDTLLRTHDYDRFRSTPELYTNEIIGANNLVSMHYRKRFRNNDGLSFTFHYKRFDQSPNPFQLLNIAPALANERVGFLPKDVGHEWFPLMDVDNMVRINNWYSWSFRGKNNPTALVYEGSDKGSRDYVPYEQAIQLSYKYRKDGLPVQCSIYSKYQLLQGEGKAKVYGTALRRFYFRYLPL